MSTQIIPAGGGASGVTTRQAIIGWTLSRAYALTAATYDSSGCISSATITWPDGSSGQYTTSIKNSVFNAVDAYTITHVNSGLVLSQAIVTRDSNGNITAQTLPVIA